MRTGTVIGKERAGVVALAFVALLAGCASVPKVASRSIVSPDGRGVARFDKPPLDRKCNGDPAACDVLAENELRELGAGVPLAATPGAAARVARPIVKVLPTVMKAWLALSLVTTQHHGPGGKGAWQGGTGGTRMLSHPLIHTRPNTSRNVAC